MSGRLLGAITMLGIQQMAMAQGADLEGFGVPAQTVITPTRLKQAVQDVPASVTIITAEQIQRLGVRSVPDALQLVAGMQVTQTTGSTYEINYHGGNARNARRLNVLVDGVSVYRPGLAHIDWTALPVSVEDIARIEVTRGPNSAAWGPNSMQAVINIVTHHPQDVPEWSVMAQASNQGDRQQWLRHAFSVGQSHASLGLSGERSGGYAQVDDDAAGHDSYRTGRLNWRSHTPLAGDAQLNVMAALVHQQQEVPFKSDYEDYPDKRNSAAYLSATYTRPLGAQHDLQVRLTHSNHRTEREWLTCFPKVVYVPELYTLYRMNPVYANTVLAGKRPTGGSPQDDAQALLAMAAIAKLGPSAMLPQCGLGQAHVREARSDLEVQDTVVWSDRTRGVLGLGLRHQAANSATYLNGDVETLAARGFMSLEHRLTPSLLGHLGWYAEHDRLTGFSSAPRLALNWEASPGHSWRVVAARGTRTPDLAEQKGEFSYRLQAFEPGPDSSMTPRFYQSARSPGGLKPEVNEAVELGYLLRWPVANTWVDLRLFRERLTRLVSASFDVVGFNPSNDGQLTLQGLEVQGSWRLSPHTQADWAYTYLSKSQASSEIEQSQYARHSGSVAISTAWGAGWRAALRYHGQSAHAPWQGSAGRVELLLGRKLRLGSLPLELQAFASALQNAQTSYFFREGRAEPAVSTAPGRYSMGLQLRLSQ